MRLTILATALFLSPLFLATPSQAENPEHVKRLLTTKECQQCDLRGANLSGVDLSFAVLVGADLREANLTRANLRQADLTGANLSKTNLNQANLNSAYLNNANLDSTLLVGASLTGTRGLPLINRTLANLPLIPLGLYPPLISRPLPALYPPLKPVAPPLITSRRVGPRISISPYQQTIAPVTSQSQISNPVLPLLPSSLPPLPPPPLYPPNTAQAPRLIPPKPENPTTSQQPANIYPPKFVQSFMEGCTKKSKQY